MTNQMSERIQHTTVLVAGLASLACIMLLVSSLSSLNMPEQERAPASISQASSVVMVAVNK